MLYTLNSISVSKHENILIPKYLSKKKKIYIYIMT